MSWIPVSRILLFLGLLMLLVSPGDKFCNYCEAAPAVGYDAYNWDELPQMRVGFETGLASSYDREGGNADFSQYEFPEGPVKEAVTTTVKTIDGPGVVYRFWMPHMAAKKAFDIRMYFDGESTPRLDTDSFNLLGGTFGTDELFRSPLVTTSAGGQVSYEPIPFAESLRIETENLELPDNKWSSNRHYYQYSYVTFPDGADVVSYSGELGGDQIQARDKLAAIFENAGSHPSAVSEGSTFIAADCSSIAAGANQILADITGPGIVRSILLDRGDVTDEELERLRLQVFYDASQEAAVDVSVAHFFGAGRERALYRSLPIGTDAADSPGSFYCYWPMPFRSNVLIRLQNGSDHEVSLGAASVEYESKSIDARMCYLHAKENTSVKQSGQIYHTILSTDGAGHYVGELLYVEQPDWSFYILEGDDVITVDAEHTLYGTGLEDTYNGGYYYNWVGVQQDEPEGGYPQSATRPLHGILYVHREDGVANARADQYRWRVADAVSFRRSIDVKVENRYAVNGATWTSVGFWYELPCPLADLNGDCEINLLDLTVFAENWLLASYESGPAFNGADMTGDLEVDWEDFSAFSQDYTGDN